MIENVRVMNVVTKEDLAGALNLLELSEPTSESNAARHLLCDYTSDYKKKVIAAKIGSQMVGLLLFQIKFGLEPIQIFAQKKKLVIHPMHQKRGIAKKLILETFKICEETMRTRMMQASWDTPKHRSLGFNNPTIYVSL